MKIALWLRPRMHAAHISVAFYAKEEEEKPVAPRESESLTLIGVIKTTQQSIKRKEKRKECVRACVRMRRFLHCKWK